jgi:precorrin-4 methylase
MTVESQPMPRTLPDARGKVFLLGAGPGAADLVTVRAARAIADSDIVIWGRPLATEELVREHASPSAEVIAWPPATMADLEDAYDRAAAQGLTVARLHGGDPAIYARLAEELERVRGRGLEVEVIPGVTAACAAASALGWELTNEADRKPLVFASATASGGALAPELATVAGTGSALALYMVGSAGPEVQRILLREGYSPRTSCAIAHGVSWPGERLVACSLDELADCLSRIGEPRNTLLLVAPAR